MSISKRNHIFVAGLVFMVCALNFGLYVLDGSSLEFDEHNKEGLPILIATLIAGPWAIAISGYRTVNLQYPLDRGKRSAWKAGLFSVLKSYLYLGGILVFLLPLCFLILGCAELDVGFFMGALFGFGAMIVAFMVSVWIAAPLAIGWAMLLATSTNMQPVVFKRLGLLRLLSFVLLIFIAAVWVAHEVIPFKGNTDANMINEMTLLCGFISALSAAFCWYFFMEKEEGREQGALAGLTTAIVAVCLIGPAIAVQITISENGFSFDEFFKSSVAAAIFSFFAVLLAAWKAVPVSVVIGFLVAKSGPLDLPYQPND